MKRVRQESKIEEEPVFLLTKFFKFKLKWKPNLKGDITVARA